MAIFNPIFSRPSPFPLICLFVKELTFKTVYAQEQQSIRKRPVKEKQTYNRTLTGHTTYDQYILLAAAALLIA